MNISISEKKKVDNIRRQDRGGKGETGRENKKIIAKENNRRKSWRIKISMSEKKKMKKYVR